MDSLTYRAIKFPILQSLGWEKEPMLDQAGHSTYTDTRIRGSVILAYNPGAASFKPIPGDPLGTPFATPGLMPAKTELSIRRFLEQPRGELVVTSAGVDWLVSPQFRGNDTKVKFPCDTRNGPFTKVNSVQYIPGERLWKIHLEIETYINERPIPDSQNPPNLIVSNRWYAIDDTNWQHLRTRIYQGTCIVRGDMLRSPRSGGTTLNYVDALRSSFAAFSVPLGFQRERVHVTVTPDGNAAHYTVVDVEQLFNKAGTPAVRVEVADTDWIWSGSYGRAIAQAGGALALAYRAASIPGLNIREVNERGFAMASDLSRAVVGNLPKTYKSVLVRCWGNQRQPRGNLLNYALAVLATRMFVNQQPLVNTTTSEIIASRDTNNYVQVQQTVNYGTDVAAGFLGGPIGGIAVNVPLFQQAFGNAQASFNASLSSSPNTSVGGSQLSQSAQPLLANVPFPADSGTRGTASATPTLTNGVGTGTLQTLITQTLESFDGDPPAVP